MSLRTLAAIVALAGSLASTAQTTVPASSAPGGDAKVSSPGTPGLLARPAKNPYGTLFKSPVARQQFSVTDHPRKTVCGLTVLNVSRDLDPKAVLRPMDPGVEHKIKKIAPPVCQE